MQETVTNVDPAEAAYQRSKEQADQRYAEAIAEARDDERAARKLARTIWERDLERARHLLKVDQADARKRNVQ